MKYFLLLGLAITFVPAFGVSHPEYFGINDPLYYELSVDDHVFNIPYQVDADVLAMAVDTELNSFLIGLDKTNDSIMVIDLEHEIISAENNEFAVLVNGIEVGYDLQSDSDSSTLSFFVPAFTEEVEIIGTHVIPEFPFGVLIVLIATIVPIIVLSKSKLSVFRL